MNINCGNCEFVCDEPYRDCNDGYDNHSSLYVYAVYNGNILDENDKCECVATFDDYEKAEKYIAENSKNKLWSIINIKPEDI